MLICAIRYLADPKLALKGQFVSIIVYCFLQKKAQKLQTKTTANNVAQDFFLSKEFKELLRHI